MDVELSVRVRHQTSQPLYTDGQIKQGDPFSPLKYALITAMAQWWIRESYGDIGFELAAPQRALSHLPADQETLIIQCLAATDDTLLLATTAIGLQALTYAMEFFQAAYNMETEWDKPDKTTIFVLGPQDKIHELPPIELTLADDSTKSLRVSRDRKFLRTPINNPKEQGEELVQIAQAYAFPVSSKPLPITAIRRIAQVSLAGKLLARLQMHPVQNHVALRLTSIMNAKVQKYFKQPYAASRNLLVAPIREAGNGFPNFDKLNAIWSIAAIHRGLNSANPTIKLAFQIIYATFQCGGLNSHRCRLPFAPSQIAKTKTPPHKKNLKVWEIARQYMIDMDMRILPAKRTNTGDWPRHNEIDDNLDELRKDRFGEDQIVSRAKRPFDLATPHRTKRTYNMGD